MSLRIPALALLISAAGCFTQELPDTVQPIKSTVPADHATGVRPDAILTATMANDLDTATVTAKSFLVTQNGKAVAGAVTASGPTATFTPDAEFAANSAIVATLTTDVHYVTGAPLPKAQSWSFATGAALDHTPPTVLATTPAPDATGVPPGSPLTVTFSESMSAITTSIFKLQAHGGAAVAGTVSLADTVATFTPSAPLAQNTLYDATITTGATDLSGNALQQAHTWSFTTAIVPFGVLSAQATSTTRATVTFSDPPKAAEAGIVSNFCIGAGTDTSCSNVLPVAAASASGAVVTLTTGVQGPQAAYKVFVNGVTRDPDGVSLQTNTATFAGFNLIQNGSFDADTNTPPAGWTKTSGTTSELIAFAGGSPAAFDGPNIAKFGTLSSSTGGTEVQSSCFPIDNTKTITIKANFQTPEAVANVQYAFKVFGFTDTACATAGTNPSASSSANLAAQNVWEQHSATFTPAATVNSARAAVRAKFVAPGTAASVLYLDNVIVTQP